MQQAQSCRSRRVVCTADLDNGPPYETDSLAERLVRLCAVTNRGRAASPADSARINGLVGELEALVGPPDLSDGGVDGRWRLIYASTEPYRVSPFFWGLRKRLTGLKAFPSMGPPGDDSLASSVYAFTDSIPFKSIGAVYQTLSGTTSAQGELVSEVELVLSVFDAILPPQRSFMTTTCSAAVSSLEPSKLELRVLKTETKQSSISAVLPIFDQFAFPSAQVLPDELELRTTLLLPSGLRVCRNSEPQAASGADELYIWCKELPS